MERIKNLPVAIFKRFRKAILIILTGVAGMLLTLAGLGLITLTLPLILYSGIALLILTVLFYFFT
ncbi:MAG: hypothetical protein Q7R43_00485 [Candidatus Daviesbacteria bacterium]|nr:hypothetical protein [Candidatus Daviesbacteria bacterium]